MRRWLFALTFLMMTPGAARAASDLGVDMLAGSKRVGDHRYDSPRDYTQTVKAFRDRHKHSRDVQFLREVSVGGVRYTHIKSLNPKTKWDGINVYLLPTGQVRYTILPRQVEPPAKAPTTPSATPATKN